jgi:PilZ domain
MSRNHNQQRDSGRMATRVHTVERISVNYEGRTEEVADRLPDVSPRGMFINTNERFTEGAVLNLSFRLALSGAEIRTRCEVRYCQPGVGVGVEFIGMSPEATRQIEAEIELCGGERSLKRASTTKSRGRRRKTGLR